MLVRSGGVAEFFRSLHDDLLKVGGESLIEGLAHEHRRRSIDVIAHREVFLHFVELGAVYKGDRIFLRVDGLLEQCGVELAEVDGGRVGAEGLEEFKVSRNRLNADFDSLQIGGALYGRFVVRDLAEAVLREAEEADALRQDLFIEDLSKFSVERFVSGSSVLEKVRQVDDLELRRNVRGDSRREHRHFDRAERHAFEHLAFAAKLGVRVDVDGDASAGGLFHVLFKGFVKGDDVGLLIRGAVTELYTVLLFCKGRAESECYQKN